MYGYAMYGYVSDNMSDTLSSDHFPVIARIDANIRLELQFKYKIKLNAANKGL